MRYILVCLVYLFISVVCSFASVPKNEIEKRDPYEHIQPIHIKFNKKLSSASEKIKAMVFIEAVTSNEYQCSNPRRYFHVGNDNESDITYWNVECDEGEYIVQFQFFSPLMIKVRVLPCNTEEIEKAGLKCYESFENFERKEKR